MGSTPTGTKMTSYRLPTHTANVSLATLTEANRLMDKQAARPSKHSPVPATRRGHHIGLLALL